MRVTPKSRRAPAPVLSGISAVYWLRWIKRCMDIILKGIAGGLLGSDGADSGN
ncbi:hypothetical protein CLOSTHATH_00462 [Hungatella hathewayi DSM 13479]|jgi:hypothetical protein|uniref:Uncharacterized protein n=1 Tax=Hungatella hathewayi DSM 13479 TaxID=566550 RepID=D3AA41_9FIRM|nr:hypothetical protein CLOSTHATH_00462 [Hungatella hathewayi DSM 13479]